LDGYVALPRVKIPEDVEASVRIEVVGGAGGDAGGDLHRDAPSEFCGVVHRSQEFEGDFDC
jgi:hypothetical protein